MRPIMEIEPKFKVAFTYLPSSTLENVYILQSSSPKFPCFQLLSTSYSVKKLVSIFSLMDMATSAILEMLYIALAKVSKRFHNIGFGSTVALQIQLTMFFNLKLPLLIVILSSRSRQRFPYFSTKRFLTKFSIFHFPVLALR